MKKAVKIFFSIGTVAILVAIVYGAGIPSRYFVSGVLTEWAKTDTSLAVNVDTLNLKPALRIYIDSLINLTTSSSVREELKFTGDVNFSNNANDSTNVLINSSYHLIQFAYNMYADRAMIDTKKPCKDGPTTFRDDLPRIGSLDTLLIMRISRNSSFAAGQRIGLTLYKVARSAGLSFTKTQGVFYDMIRFDEGEFNAAGVSTEVRIQLLLKKNR